MCLKNTIITQEMDDESQSRLFYKRRQPKSPPQQRGNRNSNLVSQSRLSILECQFEIPSQALRPWCFDMIANCETQSTGRHHAGVEESARISICDIWNCVTLKPPQIARQLLREFLGFARNFVCSPSLSHSLQIPSLTAFKLSAIARGTIKKERKERNWRKTRKKRWYFHSEIPMKDSLSTKLPSPRAQIHPNVCHKSLNGICAFWHQIRSFDGFLWHRLR